MHRHWLSESLTSIEYCRDFALMRTASGLLSNRAGAFGSPPPTPQLKLSYYPCRATEKVPKGNEGGLHDQLSIDGA